MMHTWFVLALAVAAGVMAAAADAAAATTTTDARAMCQVSNGYALSYPFENAAELVGLPKLVTRANGSVDAVYGLRFDDTVKVVVATGSSGYRDKMTLLELTTSASMSVAAVDVSGRGDLVAVAVVDFSEIWFLVHSNDDWSQRVSSERRRFYSDGGRLSNMQWMDASGDGLLDAIGYSSGGKTGFFAFNNETRGLGTWTRVPIGSYDARLLTVADFNGDGEPDILGAQTKSPYGLSLAISNSGTVSYANAFNPVPGIAISDYTISSYTLGSDIVWVLARDVDLDGTLDLVLCNDNDELALFYNVHGNGTLDTRATISIPGLDCSQAVAELVDVDADGRIDLVYWDERNNNQTLVWGPVADMGATVGPWTAVPTQLAGLVSPWTAVQSISSPEAPVALLATFMSSASNVVFGTSDSGGTWTRVAEIDLPLVGVPVYAFYDIDGDGRDDVVRAGTTRIQWTRSDGTGGFERPRTLSRIAADAPHAYRPQAMAFGDVNGDGHNDLVVVGSAWTSGANDTVVWYAHQDGVGTFDPVARVVTDAIDGVDSAVALVDLTGSGAPDVVVGWSSTIGWFANDGSGVFSGPNRVVEGASLGTLAAADLDGDGTVDLAIGSTWPRTELAVWYNTDGAGTFGEGTKAVMNVPLSSAPSLAVGDLNGDGVQDLVFVQRALGAAWLSGVGPARHSATAIPFAAMGDMSLGSNGVLVGDADGDGVTDVVVSGGKMIVVVRNVNGAGTAWNSVLVRRFAGYSISAHDMADVDGDGVLDILYGVPYGSEAGVALSGPAMASTGTVTSVQYIHSGSGLNSNTLSVGDLNGDAVLDYVTTLYSNEIVWIPGTRVNWVDTSGQQVVSDEAVSVRATAVGDLDNDGDLDVVSVSSGDSKVAWYPNEDGRGTFGDQAVIAFGVGSVQNVQVADIGGDGWLDVVVQTTSSSVGVRWWANSGAGGAAPSARFGAWRVISAAAQPSGMTVGDFNGDGAADVAVWFVREPTIGVYLSNGTDAPFVVLYEGDPFGTAKFNTDGIVAADVDGDGDDDLIVVPDRSITGLPLQWMETLGPGSVAPFATLVPDTELVTGVTLADLDRDGDMDLVARVDLKSVCYEVYDNDGTGALTKLTGVDQYDGWCSTSGDMAVVDVNSDGQNELVSSSALFSLAAAGPFTPVVGPVVRISSGAFGGAACKTSPFSATCLAAVLSSAPPCANLTVVLDPGVYACRADSHLVVAQDVTLVADTLGTVVFDCADAGVLFQVTGSLTLRNIELAGLGRASSTLTASPGIRVDGTGARLHLDSCIVRDSTADIPLDGSVILDAGLGGAVFVTGGGALTATQTEFRDNVAFSAGGAVYARGSGTRVRVTGGLFTGNSATRGGALCAEHGASIDIQAGTVFEGNVASGRGGGAAYVDKASTLTARDATLQYNTAGTKGGGGALHVRSGALVELDGVTMRGNTAGQAGGATMVVDDSLVLGVLTARTSLAVPVAPSSMAGAAQAGALVSIRMTNVVLDGNAAGRFGDGLFVCGSAVGVDGGGTVWSGHTGAGDVFVCGVSGLSPGMVTRPDSVPWLRIGAAAWVRVAPTTAKYTAPLASMIEVSAVRTAMELGVPLGGRVQGVDWIGQTVVEDELVLNLVFDGVPAGFPTSGTAQVKLIDAVVDMPNLAFLMVQGGDLPELPQELGWSLLAETQTVMSGTVTLTGCVSGNGLVTDSESGLAGCAVCPDGLWSFDGNTESCFALPPCPLLTQRLGNTTTADASCVCQAGAWTPTGATDTECIACPAGGVCPGGLAKPVASAGFFPDPSRQGVFIECPVAEACAGNGKCATGYTAQLCGKCADGWYKLGSRCHKCDTSKNALIVVALLVVLTAAIAVLVAFSLMESVRYKFAAAMIGLNSLQITAMYGQLELDWGEFARVYFDVASALNVDLELTSPECAVVSGVDVWVLKWVLTLLLPVFVCAGVSLVGLVYAGVVATGLGSRVPFLRNQSMASLAMGCVRTMFQIVVLLYLPLARAAFAPFSCRKDESGRWVMDPDPSRSCYNTAWWSGLFVPALAAIVVYAVGLPAAVLGVLTRMRRRLDPVTYTLRFGFLVGRFVDEAWWFEAALMARKVGVVLCMTLFFADSSKANSAAVLLMCSLGHLVFSQPYRSGFHNGLAVFVLGMTSLVLYAGTFADFTLRRTCVVMGVVSNVLAILIGNGVDIWLIARDEAQAEKDADASEFDGQTVELADVVESSMVHETALDDRARGESISQAIVVDEVVSFQQPVLLHESFMSDALGSDSHARLDTPTVFGTVGSTAMANDEPSDSSSSESSSSESSSSSSESSSQL